MTNPYEATFNPSNRSTNGSAYEFFGTNPSAFGAGMQPPNYQQAPQQHFGQQQWQQPGFQNWQQQYQPWQTMFGPWNAQQNVPLSVHGYGNVNPWQQLQPGVHGNVMTTKAVEVELTIPAQRIIGRHPAEIQQYIQQVVLPVLLDGLVRRALNNDVGQSISSDYRECVARIGL